MWSLLHAIPACRWLRDYRTLQRMNHALTGTLYEVNNVWVDDHHLQSPSIHRPLSTPSPMLLSHLSIRMTMLLNHLLNHLSQALPSVWVPAFQCLVQGIHVTFQRPYSALQGADVL